VFIDEEISISISLEELDVAAVFNLLEEKSGTDFLC
jgi:hypothetical protein